MLDVHTTLEFSKLGNSVPFQFENTATVLRYIGQNEKKITYLLPDWFLSATRLSWRQNVVNTVNNSSTKRNPSSYFSHSQYFL